MSFWQFLAILRARRPMILMITLTLVVATAAVTVLLPERYQATASLVVDPGAASAAGASGGKLDDVLSTQLDIIMSPATALRVVDALGLERRQDIGTLVAESRPLHRVWWMIAARLRADDDTTGQPTSLRDWIADRLLKNLTVKSNRDSRLIKVTYSAPEAKFTAAVANAFIEGYLATVRELQAGPARENTRVFEEQVEGLKKNLEQAESKLAKFQQDKGILATDERMDLETGRLSELSGQLAMAQSQSYESQARQRQLRDFLASGGKGEPPGEIMASSVVQQLRQGVAEREAKLSELARRIGPNHPQYQSAATELSRLRAQLMSEMRMAAQGALATTGVAPAREGALRGALEQQRSRVLKLKTDRNTLAMLVREVDGQRQAYEEALKRLTQTRMASDSGQGNGALVDSAVAPVKPASPSLPFNVAVALAAGLALGVGLALLGESLSSYVRSEQDLVELVGAPVLAVLVPRGAGRGARYLASPNVYSLPKP